MAAKYAAVTIWLNIVLLNMSLALNANIADNYRRDRFDVHNLSQLIFNYD